MLRRTTQAHKVEVTVAHPVRLQAAAPPHHAPARAVPGRERVVLGTPAASTAPIAPARRRWLRTASLLPLLPILPLSPVRAGDEPLRLLLGGVRGVPPFECLPLWLAQRLGYLQAAGLSAPLLDGVVEASEAERAPVHCLAFEQVLARNAGGGVPWRAFALLTRTPQRALVLSRRVLADHRPALLQGLRVGVPAAPDPAHTLLRLVAQRARLPADALQLHVLEDAPAALQALRADRVDALCWGEPVLSLLESQRLVQTLADTRSSADTVIWYGGPMPGTVLAAPAAWLAAQPQQAQALTVALQRALRWVAAASASDWVRQLPASWMLGARPAYLRALDGVRPLYSLDGRMSASAALTAQRVMHQMGLPVKAHDGQRAFTNEFAEHAEAPARSWI